MASESRRVILIVGTFIVLGVGGALYYLMVYQPGKDRDTARAQVKEWEVRWDAARTCLLGDKPLAADVGDAITARELMMGTTEHAMGDCTKTVAALVRPPGNDTGVTAVENQWPIVEAAMSKVAQGYAEHRASPLGENPLPAALDELSAAHRELRKAAGMSALPAIQAPAAAPLAPTPMMLDGAAVSDLGGITVDGVVRGQAQVMGRGAFDVEWSSKGLTGTPVVAGLRSLPGRTWGAAATRDDQTGTTTLTAGEPPVMITKVKGVTLAPQVALGDGPQRLVLYSIEVTLFIARSTDGGKKWTSSPIPTKAQAAFAVSPAGDRLDLAWTGPKGMTVMSVSPTANATGPLPEPTVLPAQELATWCTGGAFWLVGGTATGYLVMSDGKGPGVEVKMSQPRPIACNHERVVLRGEEDTAVDYACSATECTPLPDTGDERVIGLVGLHVVRAAARSNLLAIWRDTGPVAFYHLPAPREVYGVADVGGQAVVLLLDPDNTVLEQATLPP